jgi:hypothetical protein
MSTIANKQSFQPIWLSSGICYGDIVVIDVTATIYDLLQLLIAQIKSKTTQATSLNYAKIAGETYGEALGFHIPLKQTVQQYLDSHKAPENGVINVVFGSGLSSCPPHQCLHVALAAYEKQLTWPLWQQGSVCSINLQALGSSDDIEKRRGKTTDFNSAETNFPGWILGIQIEKAENITWVNTVAYLRAYQKRNTFTDELLTKYPINDSKKFMDILTYIVKRQFESKESLCLPILQLPTLKVDERYNEIFQQDLLIVSPCDTSSKVSLVS